MYFCSTVHKTYSERKYTNAFQNSLYIFYKASIKLLFHMPSFNDFKNSIMKIILK